MVTIDASHDASIGTFGAVYGAATTNRPASLCDPPSWSDDGDGVESGAANAPLPSRQNILDPIPLVVA
jgi:hypothetical protein